MSSDEMDEAPPTGSLRDFASSDANSLRKLIESFEIEFARLTKEANSGAQRPFTLKTPGIHAAIDLEIAGPFELAARAILAVREVESHGLRPDVLEVVEAIDRWLSARVWQKAPKLGHGIADRRLRELIEEDHTCAQILGDAISLATDFGVDAGPFIRDRQLGTVETLADASAALHRLRQAIAATSDGKLPGTPKKKRKRGRPPKRQERPLTSTERLTMEVVSRNAGNIVAASKELGRDPKTVKENWERASKKLASILERNSRSISASRLPEDRRGQPNV